MTDYVPGAHRTDTYEHRNLVYSPAFTTRAPLRAATVVGDDGRGVYRTKYVPGVSRTGRGMVITGTKRIGYNDGEARTGHSMLTYILL